MLYWDNHDSFLKVAGYAYAATLGRNHDLSPKAAFAKKLADVKAVPMSMKSTPMGLSMSSSSLARDR